MVYVNGMLSTEQLLVSWAFFMWRKWSYFWKYLFNVCTQPAFACSKLIIETLDQVVKHVQS